MKKIITILVSIIMVLAFVSCGSSTPTAPERDLAEGTYEEVGDGAFYIASESGSSRENEEVFVYPDMDSTPYTFIDYEYENLDGKLLTYTYLDGIELDKKQIGESCQGYFGLDQEWQITEGNHTIEVVQYADNDTNGDMVFYRSETFEVKSVE